MGTWEAWAYRLVNVGFSNFYSKEFFSEYFPGYLYILWAIGEIYHLIFSKLSYSSFQFEVVLKLVTTVFDIGTSYLIYKTVDLIKPKLAVLASLIYFANPAVIFNSSVWGQVDGVYAFFLVLSSYLLMNKNKYLSSASSSAALLIKPQAVFFLPILFIKVLKDHGFLRLLLAGSIFILVFLLFSFPFFAKDLIGGIIGMSQRSADLYPYTSLFAFNFWGIFGWWRIDLTTFFISFKNWGILVYFIFLIAISLPIFLNKTIKNNKELVYLSFTLSLFSGFLFLTRMHERYLFPVLAFYLVYAIKEKKHLIIYFFITLIHFLNLWYVYYYYDFLYNSTIHPNELYKLIDNYHNLLSLGLIGIFFYLLVNYYDRQIKKTT